MTKKDHDAIIEALKVPLARIYDMSNGKRMYDSRYEKNQLGGFRLAINTLATLMKDRQWFDYDKFIEGMFPIPEE